MKRTSLNLRQCEADIAEFAPVHCSGIDSCTLVTVVTVVTGSVGNTACLEVRCGVAIAPFPAPACVQVDSVSRRSVGRRRGVRECCCSRRRLDRARSMRRGVLRRLRTAAVAEGRRGRRRGHSVRKTRNRAATSRARERGPEWLLGVCLALSDPARRRAALECRDVRRV